MNDRLKSILKILKITSLWGGSALYVVYHIRQTCRSLNKIVNPGVLDAEKKYVPEYIYIDDPQYTLKMEKVQEARQSVGIARIWKSLKQSLACRLLWLCRHGNSEQRNIALERLASFKNNKKWDCLKLAQTLDMNTAVLLARTHGADLRYFLPPPIHIRRAALTSELMSFKLRDMIIALQNVSPHTCIHYFLSKYFANLQEQAMEADSVPAKPDSISEKDLCLMCLDAIYHHIILFYSNNYSDDKSTLTLIHMGLLARLAELLLRYRNDEDLDWYVLKILTVLSVHTCLLKDFFLNGLIGELSRLIRSDNVRLASSAAVCLANLSGEHSFKPGLFLLHPLYRTRNRQVCDILLIHGLRGGVFVTWRQRDSKSTEPLGITDAMVSKVKQSDSYAEEILKDKFLDPELSHVLDQLTELEEEGLLANYEVVLHDIPTNVKRVPTEEKQLTASYKRSALIQEYQDHCTYTHCWPKDWLPKDCRNIRILGVNYWSSLSDWLEGCPLQSADITTRAAELAPVLVDAHVGHKNVPIVWLAHSMGGLIVKQLLIDAANSSEEMKRLWEQTKAVVFYSTPHKGSALATMPRAAAAVLWPSHDVKQLQENSPILLKIQQDFIKIADTLNWETVSFAETMPTLVTTFKVPIHFVPPHSADLERGAFYELPLDHLTICKPATRQSILYTTVLDIIHRATNRACVAENSNVFIDKFLELLWWNMSNKSPEVIETVDEKNEREFRWFERILLATFTDGGPISD